MKKNIKSVSETYICPKKAGYKFRSARKFHTPLYLYGVSIPIKMSTFFGNSEHPFPEK